MMAISRDLFFFNSIELVVSPAEPPPITTIWWCRVLVMAGDKAVVWDCWEVEVTISSLFFV